MIRKVFLVVVVLACAMGISTISYAMCGMCGVEAKDMGTEAVVEQGKTVEAGNKICPVTGDKIDMSKKITHEYNGKVYNLCCPACIEPFKKDPKKYSEIADKEVKGETEKTK